MSVSNRLDGMKRDLIRFCQDDALTLREKHLATMQYCRRVVWAYRRTFRIEFGWNERTTEALYRMGKLPQRFPVPAVTKPAYFHLNYDGFEGIYIETPNGDVLVGWFNGP